MGAKLIYECQQCGEKAVVHRVSGTNEHGRYSDFEVICESCNYTISKDTADKEVLLVAARCAEADLRGLVFDSTDLDGDTPVALTIRELRAAITKTEHPEK